jgi:hypothetical protein
MPRNSAMNTQRNTSRLMTCMASTPPWPPVSASDRMMKSEKARKTPHKGIGEDCELHEKEEGGRHFAELLWGDAAGKPCLLPRL